MERISLRMDSAFLLAAIASLLLIAFKLAIDVAVMSLQKRFKTFQKFEL